MNSPHQPADLPQRHTVVEDALALPTGTLFVALGVLMFQHVGLLTGGTAGAAFLLHYGLGWSFAAAFFVLNLPFYVLAVRHMGVAFAAKTFISVALLSAWTQVLPTYLQFQTLAPWLSALAGGVLMGCGMLILFRHRASLGGFNVLALYLQERLGWQAGWLQLGLDCTIVLISLSLRDWHLVALSVLAAAVVNQTLATNHRAGRYVAW